MTTLLDQLRPRVIDLARNKVRVFQAGAITVPTGAQTLKLARLSGEGSPAGKSENAAITDADMTFDSVTFTARTLVRLVKLSVEQSTQRRPRSPTWPSTSPRRSRSPTFSLWVRRGG